MADVRSATCDICGTMKRDANHWYRVWKDDEGRIVMAPWSYDLEDVQHLHACGEDHALRLIARLNSAGDSVSALAPEKYGKDSTGKRP